MPMSKAMPELDRRTSKGKMCAGLAIAMLLVPAAFAADSKDNHDLRNRNQDQQAYCTYLTEQAAAQRDLLMTPDAIAGITQPNTGLPTQAVWGVRQPFQRAEGRVDHGCGAQ